MFVIPITVPKQVEKPDRYCDCGKRLTYYNDDSKCYACQKLGKSMAELNEALAELIEEEKMRDYQIKIQSPIPLCPEVWEELERKIHKAISNNRLKITMIRL